MAKLDIDEIYRLTAIYWCRSFIGSTTKKNDLNNAELVGFLTATYPEV